MAKPFPKLLGKFEPEPPFFEPETPARPFFAVYLCKKSLLYFKKYIYISLIGLTAACNTAYKQAPPQQFAKDSAQIINLIIKGNEIYAQKASYTSFLKSLELYDTALQIAQHTNDDNLIATAIFAKGRAYDAINTNPQKTIDYYTQAARLYAKLPNKNTKVLYIKHLVAHSYDKAQDSVNCIKTLTELYNEINPKPDSIKQTMQFTVEMALVGSEVKDYQLAGQILQHLTKREWIKNDTGTYDYLNHYYLTKARMDVYNQHNIASPFLDSLETVFNTSRNLSDSLYYSAQLYQLFKTANNIAKQGFYLQMNNTLFHKFNSPEQIRETQDRLSKMEVAAIEKQRMMEQKNAANKRFISYLLLALLLVTTVFTFFLQKRNREVKQSNKQLQQKNLQNELLNKEIHHRVKNNLQMIMSLVNMQENNTDAEEVKENMQAISLRIDGIANLHQQLMEQNEVIDLKKYVQHLVNNLANVMGDGKKIITHLQIKPITVPQKISFPLGLILNEWITNSVKYAKPLNSALEIDVAINNDEKKIRICYADNGQPQTTKPSKKSLGVDIVNLLVGQLDGVIETDPQNIFNYKLIIPLDGRE